MSLVEHARRELELCGQFVEDPAYAQSIVAAVAAFASYRHSGGSASVAIEQLHALLQFGTLSPLTDDPDEWADVTAMSSGPLWQSRRNHEAFSTDGGKTYYLLSERDAAEFVPPVATELPAGALESAVVGAARLDSRARTSRVMNLIAHALAGLAADGFLAGGGVVRQRPAARTHHSRPAPAKAQVAV